MQVINYAIYYWFHREGTPLLAMEFLLFLCSVDERRI